VFFIAQFGFSALPYPRIFSTIGSLLAMEFFELTNGYGMMSNVYDPCDYLANALGIGLALGIKSLINRPLNFPGKGREENVLMDNWYSIFYKYSRGPDIHSAETQNNPEESLNRVVNKGGCTFLQIIQIHS
jgi:hypothetical protein